MIKIPQSAENLKVPFRPDPLGLRASVLRCSLGKVDEGKTFRNMGIIKAVPVQGPAGVGMSPGSAVMKGFEPRKIHSPDISVLGGKRAVLGEDGHPSPREGQLHGPTSVDVAVVIQSAVDKNGRFQPRKIPVKEGPPRATRMLAVPHGVLKTAQDIRLVGQKIEFGTIEKASFIESILPDIEGFIDRPEGVDLEFIIAVRARDKEFDIVLCPDERIPVGEFSLDIRLIHPETHIKIIIIPEGGHPCL
jgi:hypothetical protein